MTPSRCRHFFFGKQRTFPAFNSAKKESTTCHWLLVFSVIWCYVRMLVYQWANLPLDLTWDSWLPHAPAATAKVTQNTEAASLVA